MGFFSSTGYPSSEALRIHSMVFLALVDILLHALKLTYPIGGSTEPG